MTTAMIEAPNTEVIGARTRLAAADAADIVVDSHGSFEQAGQFLVGIKHIRRTIAETFDGPIKQAHLAHKEMVAAKKKHDGPLDEAEGIVKLKMGDYSEEQERIALAAQQRKEREAREVEETRRLAEAEALEKEGRQAEAEQVIEAPIVVAVPPPPPPPKAAGISTTKHYKFKVLDVTKIRLSYMMPDESSIGSVVRRHHEAAANMVGGIEVYFETGVSARSV